MRNLKYFWLLSVSIFLFFTASKAQPASFFGFSPPRESGERRAFCANAGDPGFFKARAYDPRQHLAFANHGGLLNGGVCWWHSLFQRAALYLAVFKPADPRPSDKDAGLIIHRLAAGKSVVEIPGYSDFYSFSASYAREIQAKLEQWQRVDGFLKQAWLVNLTRKPRLPPRALEKDMDALFSDVEGRHRISWVMLKLRGVIAHAWLVVNMTKTASGYSLAVIDSNYPAQIIVTGYRRGSRALDLDGEETVPYLGRTGNLARFQKAVNAYCAAGFAPALGDIDVLDNKWDEADTAELK